NYHKVTRGVVEQSRREGKSSVAKLDCLDLDLDRTYTLKEFEDINEQLKTQTLEIGEEPVDLFELDASGKLIPMPQTPFCKETVVAEIEAFNFETGRGGRTIRAPDVAFTPYHIYRTLSEEQRWTFQGQPFTPSFVVEVENVAGGRGTKFNDLDNKFRSAYFDYHTSVQLGWLVDPQNRDIWVYKRRNNGTVGRRKRDWNDVDGGTALPGFTLDVEEIDEIISVGRSQSLQTSQTSRYTCGC
ncbi:8854_t:CDS:2, partial [Paraglomus occultum]